ncbi:double-strand break repair helicase AddA [Ensifer soli]|uniref:double-strand break repair helicase AddA n=1 Tax=Ciceribacter sp. sgz301302 TaxID=3342379 RepID=UPI0035B86DBC
MTPEETAATTAWLGRTAELQRTASDPAGSAWVSANAGSGKTHVLTQRVIRLLLAGARPSAILCLTYTKAAASEMSNRVFAELGRWVTLDDEELSLRIAAMEGKAPDAITLQTARRLFTKALETPGGLKIQTIHAFCEALLHQFPLEANVAGHFSVLDDRASAVLLAEARRLLLTAAASEEDPALAAAFATVLDLADDTGLERLLAAIVEKRSDLGRFLDHARRGAGLAATLRAGLGIAVSETLDTAQARAWPLDGLEGPDFDAYVAIAREKGGKTVLDVVETLMAARHAATPAERYRLLIAAFYSGGDRPKPRADGAFFSKAMLKADPAIEERLGRARARMERCRRAVDLFHLFTATEAALTLADRFRHDYEDLKKSRSLLDFDDLVERTARLLLRGDAGAWVHYKLDQGIDHILVDEAQDTSPVQWDIIGSLSDDFFAGASARPSRRTIFAVGDEKQSIYSFQGARPQRFHEERLATQAKVAAAGLDFHSVRLQLSFRSTEDVLSAVDAVFADPGHARGVSASGEPIVHASNRVRQPGQVDLWEMIAPAPSLTDEEDWTAAFDAIRENAPPNQLAQRIAAILDQWIGRETIATRDGVRLIEPRDVIVLVRKRDAFVNALTRALKRRGTIPVGGADRLVLTGHIAVQDLMALGRFALLPEDDLSLAAALKSPLFRLSEEEVFTLAAGRGEGESLWAHLGRQARDADGPLATVLQRLDGIVALARDAAPFDLFAAILGPGGGRAAFLARLGSEASDILDEFLSFALAQEKAGLPGLQAFLSGLEMEAPSIKREQDKGRNEVRIMTVHAAKGLEAPVVFVVDSGGRAHVPQHQPGLRLVPGAGSIDIPVWRAPGAPAAEPVEADTAAQKQRAEEEYRRLLYVAMTRAADRLVICGYRGKTDPGETWHGMIGAGLGADTKGFLAPHRFSAGGLEWDGARWRNPALGPQPAPAERTVPDACAAAPLPALLSIPPREPPHLPRPLAPSGAGVMIDDTDAERIVTSPLFGEPERRGLALQRGAILHRFLQVLPTLAPEERRPAAERYVARSVPHWPERERQAVVRSALAVLDMPEARPLFEGRSRAEVSVMGTLTLGRRAFAVSGRIDRIAVTAEAVTIADFKTDRHVPASAEAVPETYRAQLAIYRALMQPLYPGRRVDALLVFTEGPLVCAIPDEHLDRSLEALATK